jgi:hypothetical protein
MDLALRKAERLGDPVRLLRERLRAGELTQEHVEFAASLGHAAALELCPGVARLALSGPKEWGEGVIAAATELTDETLPARVAADWAERSLPKWESEHDDARPQRAIVAARTWADCPCETHRAAAESAHEAAFDAAVDYLDDDAAEANQQASTASWAAATAAEAVDHAADTAAATGNSAISAAGDRRAECEWQRLRLAAYVLGEVEIDEPAV